jgi:hypothetical protein
MNTDRAEQPRENTTPFRHEWRYEEDTGFIFARTNGTTDESDAVRYIELYARDVPAGEPGFMLCDNRNATDLTAGARKRYAKEWHPTQVYLAGYGQSFASRVVFNALMQGLALLRPQYCVTMVATEEEARAWLTDKRRAYLAQKAKP